MTTTSSDVLVDAFGRVQSLVVGVLQDLPEADLTVRLDDEANTIGWLVWHLTRIQDDHLAHVAGWPQEWTSGGWADRFRLPFPVQDTGYGHTPEQVAQVTTGTELLRRYHQATHARTVRFVGGVSDADLSRVVDERWDPPVTLGGRLVSVIGDGLQHVGQAALIRGVAARRRR